MKKNPDDNENASFERMIIDTGVSRYTVSPAWVENAGLNGILAGLVADDLNRQKNSGTLD